MIKLEANSADVQRISQRFSSLSQTLAPTVRKALSEDAGQIITDWIKFGLLSGQVLHNRTGNLRDSIKTLAVSTGVRIYQDEAMAPYGRFHEFGVPHPWTIAARDKKALHFFVGGKEVFARYVTHPGLKARPFLSRGVREKIGPAMIALEKAMNKALRGR